jgi:hypothetical protein
MAFMRREFEKDAHTDPRAILKILKEEYCLSEDEINEMSSQLVDLADKELSPALKRMRDLIRDYSMLNQMFAGAIEICQFKPAAFDAAGTFLKKMVEEDPDAKILHTMQKIFPLIIETHKLLTPLMTLYVKQLNEYWRKKGMPNPLDDSH